MHGEIAARGVHPTPGRDSVGRTAYSQRRLRSPSVLVCKLNDLLGSSAKSRPPVTRSATIWSVPLLMTNYRIHAGQLRNLPPCSSIFVVRFKNSAGASTFSTADRRYA